jgi:hypothetical protein
MPPPAAADLPNPPPPPAAADLSTPPVRLPRAGGDLPDPTPIPVIAAVLPNPPLIVAELGGGAAVELDPLRDACRQALAAVVGAAGTVVVVGDGPVWGVPEPGARGSFRPYGAGVDVTLPAQVELGLPGLPPPQRLGDLPLSLAVAAHLLASLDAAPARLFAATVPPSLGPRAAATIGRILTTAASAVTAPVASAPTAAPGAATLRAPSSGPQANPSRRGAGGARAENGSVGLVVMGDLSACRTERAPGGFRPAAAGFDASVAEAFRTGRPGRLLELDPNQAGELMVAGRVPLQVLGGAFDPGAALRGTVLYEDAPYGVGYLVALLTVP